MGEDLAHQAHPDLPLGSKGTTRWVQCAPIAGCEQELQPWRTQMWSEVGRTGLALDRSAACEQILTTARIGGDRVKHVICFLFGHAWTRHRYPPARPGDDAPEGTFRKCVRCNRVTEREELPNPPLSAGF